MARASSKGRRRPDIEAAIARRFTKRRRRRKKEATVEGRAVEFAKARGWLARKMNGLGYAHWPDRLFVPPASSGCSFWVEFKRVGQDTTFAQSDLIADLRSRGERVYVVRRFDEFETILNEHSA